MGKNRKIVNDDPILQKDYKYEKRRKQRAEEKQRLKQEEQKRLEAQRELERIKYEVDQEIQQQLQHKIKVKTKIITKMPSKFFTSHSSKKQPIKNKQAASNKTQIVLSNAQISDVKYLSYYEHYFTEDLGVSIRRENREQNKKEEIDREIRSEIKNIFRAEQTEERNVRQDQMSEGEDICGKMDIEEMQFKNAYIMEKNSIKEKQYILKENSQQQIELGSFLITSNCNPSKINLTNSNIQQSIINSYRDYIHIEAKQQSTIENFRELVLTHIISHEQTSSQQNITLPNSQQVPNQNSKGFTNGRALILTPFFGDARTIIEKLEEMYFKDFQLINREKLDSQELDDQNDFFRIGIKINWKKKTVKYFHNFNGSHIIVASPVGLKAIIGAEGQKNRDYSFLSSVQILYIDRASAILMQNWDHLTQVLKVLNQMPEHEAICNSIDQLRPHVPQLKSKLYRQSIVFSEFNFVELNSIKYQYFHNWQGCLTDKVFYPYPAILSQSESLEKQFYKFELKEPSQDLEVRFNFFKNKFWDELHSSETMTKTVIITRTYFQFIKIKDFFNRVNASAQCISEFTKKPKVQSYISQFNANKFRILLLTERAYYYEVCRIKKFQHLYFYSLPYNEYIFTELIHQLMSMQKQGGYKKIKSVFLYNKYDMMILQRLVGSKKSMEMVKEFCSNVSFIL